jgi:hypothetical protein
VDSARAPLKNCAWRNPAGTPASPGASMPGMARRHSTGAKAHPNSRPVEAT